VRSGLSSPEDAARDAELYIVAGRSRNEAYSTDGGSICILERDGSLRELSQASDSGAVDAIATPVVKPYVVAPKELDLRPA
ncbi:MAG: HD domain-containing protein, partial [Bacteroidota bacterium]